MFLTLSILFDYLNNFFADLNQCHTKKCTNTLRKIHCKTLIENKILIVVRGLHEGCLQAAGRLH